MQKWPPPPIGAQVEMRDVFAGIELVIPAVEIFDAFSDSYQAGIDNKLDPARLARKKQLLDEIIALGGRTPNATRVGNWAIRANPGHRSRSGETRHI